MSCEETQRYLKSKRQTAAYLGVSLSTLEHLMRNGLAYIRVNNMIKFRPEDLAEYIEQRRVQHGGDAAEAR